MNDQLLTAQQGDSAFCKLMSSPVSATRKRMRKAKIENDSIAIEGRSLGEMYAASKEGRLHKSPLTVPVPTYTKWLRSFMKPEDAKREDERAKAEWAAISSHPFIAAVIQGEWPTAERTRRAVSGYVNAAIPAPAPPTRQRTKSRTSRNSWPSFRAAQLSAIYADEGIAGLLSVNATAAEVSSYIEPMQEAA